MSHARLSNSSLKAISAFVGAFYCIGKEDTLDSNIADRHY